MQIPKMPTGPQISIPPISVGVTLPVPKPMELIKPDLPATPTLNMVSPMLGGKAASWLKECLPGMNIPGFDIPGLLGLFFGFKFPTLPKFGGGLSMPNINIPACASILPIPDIGNFLPKPPDIPDVDLRFDSPEAPDLSAPVIPNPPDFPTFG